MLHSDIIRMKRFDLIVLKHWKSQPSQNATKILQGILKYWLFILIGIKKKITF